MTSGAANSGAAVIILAGGKSTRLGRDKASEVLAGRPLLQHAIDRCRELVTEYVVVVARSQTLPRVEATAPLRVIEDAYPGTGPLGGIYSGLRAIGTDRALVVGCDMPLLSRALLAELLRLSPGHEAVVPMLDGMPEPLCAVYTTACIEPARRRLDGGAYKLAGLFEDVATLRVPEAEWRRLDPQALSFLNLNREEDLERAAGLIEELDGRRDD